MATDLETPAALGSGRPPAADRAGGGLARPPSCTPPATPWPSTWSAAAATKDPRDDPVLARSQRRVCSKRRL